MSRKKKRKKKKKSEEILEKKQVKSEVVAKSSSEKDTSGKKEKAKEVKKIAISAKGAAKAKVDKAQLPQKTSKTSGKWISFILLLITISVISVVSFEILSLKMSNLFFLLALPAILLAIAALFLGKLFYQWTNPYKLGEELTEHDNPAVGLAFSGYLLGLGLALVGATSGLNSELKDSGDKVWEIYKNVLVDGGVAFVISVILLRIAAFLHDKLLLYKFSIHKELQKDRNLGTGAVCCGGAIATGLILMSSFIAPPNQNSVQTQTLASYICSILGAYVVGQIIFLLGGVLFQKTTSYDMHYEIGERDNASAGVMFGSFLVGLGLVVSSSIAGRISIAGQKWWNPLLKQLSLSFVFGLAGIFVLLAIGILTIKIMFPKASVDEEVTQKNTAIALVTSAVYLTIGFIVRALFHLS